MSGKFELHLRVRVKPESRPAFEALLREAIPVYERPGGIRVRVVQGLDDPNQLTEIVEYADRRVYQADQLRVESDPELKGLLARWRQLLVGQPRVEFWSDASAPCTPWPPTLPELRTDRLLLRAFEERDAYPAAMLCGDFEIAATTLLIPHPYSRDHAIGWIRMHHRAMIEGRGPTYVITCDGDLVGAIGLMVDRTHERAELGYWIGKAHWNRGFASEAARAMVDHGFDVLKLERIFAGHYAANPASGVVLKRAGMSHEGTQRRHVLRFGVWHDLEMFGVLRSDWLLTRAEVSG
ncbi:MAG: GNAT family N-acetyltransferase [Phycisphaerales bacterium]|nr:GNAT family N-acetyltransferase [Phycisphaerales bacterium]